MFVILGAGVTRYISYEGVMPIKEGETTDVFFSEKTYLTLTLDNNKEQRVVSEDLLLSARGKNDFVFDTDFRGQEVALELQNYVPYAFQQFEEKEDGTPYLHFVESSSGSRHDHYIKKGTLENIHGVLVGFGHAKDALVNFEWVDEELKMESIFEGTFFTYGRSTSRKHPKRYARDL